MGKLTDEQKVEMIQKHATGQYSCEKLAAYYGVSGPAIRQMLKRRNIPINNDRAALARRYTLDETYFEKIDSEQKAYFLGLLYADGYNHEDRGAVMITLQDRDRHIIEKLKECLKCNKSLYFLERSKQNPNWRDNFKLEINSHPLSKQLAKLGCIQNKALVLDFPKEEQVPHSLIRHFVRGYIDGDGSIGLYQSKKFAGKNGYKNASCSLTSTVMFCEPIKEIIKKELDIECNISICYNKKTTRDLKIGGNKQVIKMLDWIYKDATVYLERKHQKYLEIKNYLSERYGY